MNKTAIKNFAVWARNKLIADITYKAGLIGVSEKGIAQPLPQSTTDLQFFDIGTKEYAQIAGKAAIDQRNALVRAIQDKERTSDYKTAYKAIIEEIAYTWFNRLVAIRFMEVNDYLPSRIRVLSSENPAKNEPDFVTTPFDTDLEFTVAEQDEVLRLKDENKLDELFRMLFIKQCNKLHEILPDLFEETNNYTELLLSISFTDKDGIVYHLVHDIPESDFDIEKEGQVEIIGWMYQFYNIEPKNEVFSKAKGTKISKEEIPAATQLFTPDWIVRYMVENSLGRIWVEGHPNDGLKTNWKYYLEDAEQEGSVQAQLEKIRTEYRTLNPEDIRVIDPCMGSGHILVYCFDVLMQIYEAQGYTQRDAAQSILENNLFGLDIDKRAAQMAYFAVMMKARQYDRRILGRAITPHVFAIEESNSINRNQLKYFGQHLTPAENSKARHDMSALLSRFEDAKEYGSVIDVEPLNWDLLERYVVDLSDGGQMSFDTVGLDETQRLLKTMVRQGKIMSAKFEAVITNPPYMAVSAGSAKLNKYIKDNYPDSKTDMFAVFIERCREMTKVNGYQAMITMHSWMFLTSYEKLRSNLLSTDTVNMAHLGARAFEEIGGEVVQTTSFVFRKSNIWDYKGTYCRLVFPNSQDGKKNMFLSGENRYFTKKKDFRSLPGSPTAYWASNSILNAFENGKLLGDIADSKQGIATADNNRFLREWYEVSYKNIEFNARSHEDSQQSPRKWYPYNKGGEFRKWYGNNDYVVNWENDGQELKAFKKSVIRNPSFYFKPSFSWSLICTNVAAFRYKPHGHIFDVAGMSCFSTKNLLYLMALCNTKVAMKVLEIIAPTINFQCGDIANIPVLVDEGARDRVESLVKENIQICRDEWDSYEISWDFKVHPLVSLRMSGAYAWGDTSPTMRLSSVYSAWEKLCEGRFNKLKDNEEELNSIFINIYGMQDELVPDVEDRDITVRKANLQRDIKSLLSYAVGCMFGRYSLDELGLIYAGGEWDAGKYSTFIPDKDNCIPITDEEYFEDDLVGQFVGWMKKAFGTEHLEENLGFIANALGNKGKTSREVIRNYFLNDFINDHIRMYQKRPIYWMFDSGKQNGFKGLVYMHRWNADTVGNLRVEYLHRMQRVYESEIIRMQEVIDNSRDSREVSAANKRKEKLQKQLKETKDYDAQIAHIALSRIDIDLDDGVKVNYEKVQTVPNGKMMKILTKM